MVFLDGSGSFNQIMHPATLQIAQEWFKEHDKQIKVLPWSVNFPKIPIQLSIYIYAFSRRFYPKRLTLHSSYSLSALAFPGNRTHYLGVASAMLYHLSHRKAQLWDVLAQHIQSIVAPSSNMQDSKDLLSWCQTPQDMFKGLVKAMSHTSELFWQHEGDLHDIRQVVLVLWLISVNNTADIEKYKALFGIAYYHTYYCYSI